MILNKANLVLFDFFIILILKFYSYDYFQKAFDIQDYKLIALKVHQLSASWSEHVKQQYIKHALRETAIHMTLKHPNIVRFKK